MEHIIKKQTFQLVLNRKLDAFRMQQQVSEHYWSDVLPALERLFDEVATEGETLHLVHLEVDLGTLTEREVSRTTWSDEVLGAITRQLREHLTAAVSGALPASTAQANPVSLCQQWLFYMEKGYLPWNVRQADEPWRRQVLEGLAVDYTSVATLRKLIGSVPSVVRRIVQQHTEAFLVHLIAILTSGNTSGLLPWLDELEIVMQAVNHRSESGKPQSRPTEPLSIADGVRAQLWERMLWVAARASEKISEKQLVQRLLEASVGHPDSLSPLTPEMTVRLPRLLPIIRAWKKKAETAAKKDRPTATEASENQAQEEAPASESSVIPEEEGIFVEHVGLVLLHPFLSTLFSRLGLTQDRKFISIATRQKALYLLHYLASGERTAEEYQLVVPKVLCMYPLHQPVARGELLSAEETEEAEHLLEEAIRQWDALKSTSADGFRQGFLQRRGKLFSKGENDYLLVETHAIDALLDHLPWNLSIIKLPWMKKMLRIEWR